MYDSTTSGSGGHGKTLDKYIGSRITKLRRARKIKAAACLAAELQISPAQLRYYEAGIKRVPSRLLYEMSLVLKVPLASFFPEDTSPEVEG